MLSLSIEVLLRIEIISQITMFSTGVREEFVNFRKGWAEVGTTCVVFLYRISYAKPRK